MLKMLKLWILGACAHLVLFNTLLGQRGETGGEGGDKGAAGKTFTQDQLDAIVQERLTREQKKFSDYEELKKFKEEHDKTQEQLKQKELESQKQYEELKKSWAEKEANYQRGIAEKDQAIKSLKIDHALSQEITKYNAYPEAAAVLKSMITLSETGEPQMTGKDTVGNSVAIALTEGVKKFLEERPHLVKAQGGNGGGTPPAGGGNGGGAGTGDQLSDLNTQLAEARRSGDHKKAGELKAKIQAHFAAKGISRDM